MKKTYIDTAMERIAPDLILKGGNVVDVFSGRVIKEIGRASCRERV